MYIFQGMIIMKCINCIHNQVCRLKEHCEKLQKLNPNMACKAYWSKAATQYIPYGIGQVVNVLAGEGTFYENKFYIVAASNQNCVCFPVNNADIKRYQRDGFNPEEIEGKQIIIVDWGRIFDDVEKEAYLQEYAVYAQYGEPDIDDFFEEDTEYNGDDDDE